jgi:hypothetical protein
MALLLRVGIARDATAQPRHRMSRLAHPSCHRCAGQPARPYSERASPQLPAALTRLLMPPYHPLDGLEHKLR